MNVGIKTLFEGEVGAKVFEYVISFSRVDVSFKVQAKRRYSPTMLHGTVTWKTTRSILTACGSTYLYTSAASSYLLSKDHIQNVVIIGRNIETAAAADQEILIE